MDADAKKTTLWMIPYWLNVLTADDGKDTVGAVAPPMLVGVKILATTCSMAADNEVPT